MTSEECVEQINILKNLTGYDKENPIVKRMQEALEMAVNALEQQPCEDKTEKFIKHKIDYLEDLASIETNEGRWREEEKYLYAVSVLEEIVEHINTDGGEEDGEDSACD